VTLAVDPNLKAASIYNEGRAAEALGEVEGAKSLYVRSLRLRPNEIVRKRLVALGGTPPVAMGDPPPCATRFAKKSELCACLKKAKQAESCEGVGKTLGGLRVWEVASWGERTNTLHYYVVHHGDTGWAAVARLHEELYDGRYIQGMFEVEHIKQEEIGSRTVYRVRTLRETDEDGYEYSRLNDHKLTLCVQEEAKMRCPLVVPIERRLIIDLVGEPDEQDLAEFKLGHGTAPPFERTHKLKVTVNQDGTAVVELKRGKKTSELKRYVGTHRLW
jgi:hypothetical protein